VRQLWNGPAASSIQRSNDASSVLSGLGLDPDFQFSSADAGATLEFIHRAASGTDIYFLSNQTGRGVSGEARFRAADRIPEIWDAKTGEIATATDFHRKAGVTIIPLSIEISGSRFVVFRQPLPNGTGKAGQQRTGPSLPQPYPIRIGGPWEVTFQKQRGAPDSTVLSDLSSLSVNPDPGIRYFSGLATYTAAFEVPARGANRLFRGRLSLGEIHDLASISIDGHFVRILWCPPYTADITPYISAGPHRIAITVADTWVNRMVGDEQLPAEAEYDESGPSDGRGALKAFPAWWNDPALPQARGRISFATWKVYDRNTPLTPAGLIGPIEIAFSAKP